MCLYFFLNMDQEPLKTSTSPFSYPKDQQKYTFVRQDEKFGYKCFKKKKIVIETNT